MSEEHPVERPETEPLAVRRKVLIYVLDDAARVLTFTQRHSPAAGMQVPAGTVEPGESPADAAARELREETGHAALADLIQVAESVDDMSEFRPELHRRSWFVTRADGFPREPWTHVESHPEQGEIVAEFDWTDIDVAIADLVAGHGAQLRAASRLRSPTARPVTRR